MTGVAILAKYLAALFTQKSFKYSADERRVIFGLSNAQAAATLAAVTVGYNVIIGETAAGEPIRLLNDSVLNGTIVMILVTCTIASFAAQRGARNISLSESISDNKKEGRFRENILIPLKDSENTDELINLSVLIKRKDNRTGVYALNVINNQESDPSADGKSHKILEKAQQTAASADIQLNTLLRYDVNVPNAIMSVIKENKVTDLVLGLHEKKEFSESFLGHTTERILGSSNVTTYIYRPVQPVATSNAISSSSRRTPKRSSDSRYGSSRCGTLRRTRAASCSFTGRKRRSTSCATYTRTIPSKPSSAFSTTGTTFSSSRGICSPTTDSSS